MFHVHMPALLPLVADALYTGPPGSCAAAGRTSEAETTDGGALAAAMATDPLMPASGPEGEWGSCKDIRFLSLGIDRSELFSFFACHGFDVEVIAPRHE